MATQILPDEEMIADSDKLLTFTAYKDDGTVINLIGGAAWWYLSPSGDPNHQLLKRRCSLTSPVGGIFTAFLDDVDTVGLDGEYIQQLEVRDSNNYKYRTAQGRFLIHPAIGEGL